MKPVKIRGYACGYNVLNSWREGMKPGAFDKCLKELDGAPLPMGLLHEHPCGTWTKLSADAKGLWCEGIITHPEALELVKSGALKELSITFRSNDDPDGTHRMSRKRAEPLLKQGLKPPKRIKIVDEQWTDHAELVEISLVDKGAFKGTWFEFA